MKVGDIYICKSVLDPNIFYVVKISYISDKTIKAIHLKEIKYAGMEIKIGYIAEWSLSDFKVYVPLTKLHCYLNGIDYERLDIQL